MVDLGSNFIFLGPQFGWEARPLPRMLYPTFSPLAPSFGYICISSHTPSFPGNSQRSSIISDTLPKGHKSSQSWFQELPLIQSNEQTSLRSHTSTILNCSPSYKNCLFSSWVARLNYWGYCCFSRWNLDPRWGLDAHFMAQIRALCDKGKYSYQSIGHFGCCSPQFKLSVVQFLTSPQCNWRLAWSRACVFIRDLLTTHAQDTCCQSIIMLEVSSDDFTWV